jgi:hypothetical protein
VQIFLDPRVNFLVRKTVYLGSVDRRVEVMEFKEFASGVFFPTSVTGHSEKGGKPSIAFKAQISDITANGPLPADIFTFRAPPGITLTDTTAGVTYQIDAQGRPISAQVRLQPSNPPPPAADGIARTDGAETREEPRSAMRWLLPASGCLFAAGIAIGLYRRWKARG